VCFGTSAFWKFLRTRALLEETNVTNVKQVRVGDIFLDRLTMDQAVDLAFENLSHQSGRALVIETANAQFVCLARTQRHFSELLSKADMVVADGMSVVAASRLLGQPCPERVTGVDLVVHLCGKAAQTGATVYFLGGKPGKADKAGTRLCLQFPKLKVAGVDCPAMGFEKDPAQNAVVLERIKSAAPDFLFVGFGAPKQEIWINQYVESLPVKTMIGVGGSFEMLSGEWPRAPRWMQQVGVEWLFRLGLEPRRLWKRYLIGNLRFMQIIAFQWASKRSTS
jgi:N-acetylglucosaminyldiphosphoundecaprenol N-acetyl-beta-D-mannosaminyltransferase